ncbi:MAG: 3-dehydroquinate synthase [Candidatus Margulisbacteria bacterium]|nr:3-dehydroquinate synthase [Candidatus Margulisiibacteriota bacterium]
MSKSASFRIENKNFKVDILSSDFQVTSVPRPYKVHWDSETDAFLPVKQLLQTNNKNLLLVDNYVLGLYLKTKKVDFLKSRTYRAEATEEFKSIENVIKVVDFLQKNSFTKNEKLVVVGGGITQDVGAFVGACYKRGISWTYFPTTLLAMCDSCIGGKAGINHNNAKNQLALFSAPAEVIINPNFLKTLAVREVNSGLGEILKLCITGGRDVLDIYSKCVKKGKVVKINNFKPLIQAALSVKKVVIEHDEFELNLRRSLNYGHTLGHALEILSDYKIPHGSAINIGLLIINEIFYQEGLFNKADNEEIKKYSYALIEPSALATMKEISMQGVAVLLQKDKKTLGNKVTFIGLKKIGHVISRQFVINQELVNKLELIKRSLFNN